MNYEVGYLQWALWVLGQTGTNGDIQLRVELENEQLVYKGLAVTHTRTLLKSGCPSRQGLTLL